VAKRVRRAVADKLAPDPPPRRKRRAAALHNDRQQIATAERAAEALFLRRNGASYDAIAKRLGVSPATAAKVVRDAIAAIPRDDAEQHRQRQIMALESRELDAHTIIGDLKRRLSQLSPDDHRHAVAYTNAIRGLHDLLTRIGESLAKLTGANAPIRHEVSVPPNAAAVRDMTDDELRKIASGDFSPIARGGAVAVDGARALGDDPARDGERDRERTH